MSTARWMCITYTISQCAKNSKIRGHGLYVTRGKQKRFGRFSVLIGLG